MESLKKASCFDKKVDILDLTAEYKQRQEILQSRADNQINFNKSVLLVVKFINKLKQRVKKKKIHAAFGTQKSLSEKEAP